MLHISIAIEVDDLLVGEPGTWTVSIELIGFSGTGSLSLEAVD